MDDGQFGQRPPVKLSIGGLFPLQRRLVEDAAREVWCASGTKGGKTRAMAAWLVIQAGKRGPGHYWWVGPWDKSTQHGFEEIARIVEPLEKRGAARIIWGDKIIRLANGAVIEARTGENPQGLYGPSVKAVVVDEATRCRDAVYFAIRSVTTPTRAPIRFMFNVDRGRRNWAIQRFLKIKDSAAAADDLTGRTDDGKLAYYHFPTSENPHIERDEIEDNRRNMPEKMFEALYLAKIQDDGLGVFTEKDVEAAATVEIVRDPKTGLAVPESHSRYVIGVDLARKHDYTVAIAIDTRTMQVADFLRFTAAEWTVQMDRVTFMAKQFRARLIVESNGPGDPIVEMLQKRGLAVTPFITTNLSKTQIISDLMLAFEQRKIFIPTEKIFPNLYMELLQFDYKYSKSGQLQYSAPEGFYDDCVMALAFAYFGAKAGPGAFGFAPGQVDGPSFEEQWRKSY